MSYESVVINKTNWNISDNGAINISLAKYNVNKKGAQVFNASTTLYSKDIVNITVIDVNLRINYYIIQIHSFQLDTILSYSTNFSSTTAVQGTNIGLVQKVTEKKDYNFFIKNDNLQNDTVLILIVAYPNNGNI